MRAEYLVEADTAARMARASTWYRLTRPAFWIPVVVELALGVALGASGHWALGGLLLAVGVLGPLLLVLQMPLHAAEMGRRGYRPGSVLSVEWDDSTFTVSTLGATGTHHYVSVTGARVVGSTVAMRIRGARVLLVLPIEVVPGEARPRLGLAPLP